MRRKLWDRVESLLRSSLWPRATRMNVVSKVKSKIARQSNLPRVVLCSTFCSAYLLKHHDINNNKPFTILAQLLLSRSVQQVRVAHLLDVSVKAIQLFLVVAVEDSSALVTASDYVNSRFEPQISHTRDNVLLSRLSRQYSLEKDCGNKKATV